MFNYFYLPSLLSWCYLQCVSHDKKKKKNDIHWKKLIKTLYSQNQKHHSV